MSQESFAINNSADEWDREESMGSLDMNDDLVLNAAMDCGEIQGKDSYHS